MSDAFQPLSQGIEMTVSIPAMPGQHVGHQKGLNIVKHDEGGFNPRDAGAACRTRRRLRPSRFSRRFQSPRCRGSMSDCGRCRWADGGRRHVSIPAMPGQHVGPSGESRETREIESFNPRDAGAACRTATINIEVYMPAMVVSIPAMPGQHVGRGRQAEWDPSGIHCFNPRDAGAACRTL